MNTKKYIQAQRNLALNSKHLKLNTLKSEQLLGQPEPSFVMGVTQFFDLSPEEFRARYLTLNKKFMKQLRQENIDNVFPVTSNKDAPESWDWREKGAVTSVKNQGMCGSCWAFSAIGNIEGQYQLKTGRSVDLSPQQLVDCDIDGQDQGCNGGDMDTAFNYISRAGGIISEADYPYTGSDDKCKFDKSKVVTKITGFTFAPSDDEEQIKTFLYNTGPLSIGINATPLQFYFFGIFSPWAEWICDPADLNHGVVLVGYGVQTSILGTKTPYWIVKNSWGWYWGERGYFRIVRGSGACGMNKDVLSAIIDTKK